MKDVSHPTNTEESERESGVPGGGKGRKDDVGRSGVYPMSGPHPPGNVELKPQASWGQGQRGAAGYEDHGGSALTWEGGQLLGGFDTGPGGEPRARPAEAQKDVDVPHEQWLAFLDSFSRQHLDWLVTIEVESLPGTLVAVEQRQLKGISIDRADGKERVYVQVGYGRKEHITHIVDSPIRIRFRRSEAGAHEGLEIESVDGTTTVIRFRSAARPEMLNGIAV